MKGKNGICLILCLLLILALAPICAAAPCGESVDGVWASVALTGKENKILFSADSEIERRILEPDRYTPEHYILPAGAVYDEKSNTLTLTDFNAPTSELLLTMMGGDFKLCLVGSCSLASIRSESMGRGGSLTLCGDGALTLEGEEYAILLRADGAPDFVRIEPQLCLNASADGSVVRVVGSSLSGGAISIDTSEPFVQPIDNRRAITGVGTDTGKTVDLYTLPGEDGLYGVEAVLLFDEQGERIAYNVYPLGEENSEGVYTAGERVEENLFDLSAYERVYTPHDWTLAEAAGGVPAARVRFARYTISASAPEGNGRISVSQTSVSRGGSVEVKAIPDEGYKLSALTVNGAEVSAARGSYHIGGITADQIITASFAEATATQIEIAAPAQTLFEIPAEGESFVSEPFAALVTDGTGDPIGAAVTWSLDPAAAGVSIGEDGRVTLTSAALAAAAEGKDFSVRASLEGTELLAESGFSVRAAERRAAEIHLSRSGEAVGEEDLMPIPAAGETASRQYTAVVFDQYGSLREEKIVWSAGRLPAGVRRSGDTLTVSDRCADGASLVLTAAAASDKSVSVSVTLRFSAPDGGTRGALRGAGEGEPVIHWPTYTLATEEDPTICYGISWDDLVTLHDDGSAELGETTIEGAFSLTAESALPHISDSFKIVFSYQDGEETKTLESEAQAVTLARKAIDASMITLSPAETPYTGTPREPAVSLRDGGRDLAAGTDFRVVGYSDNTEIGTAGVTVEGLGNYCGTAEKDFVITAIPGSSVTCTATACKPEDEGTTPEIVLRYGGEALVEGRDYEISLQYDIPAKTGRATVSFKGFYAGTRILSFDLPNYLITEGADASWSKSLSTPLLLRANGALGKFTELTVDGKTVSTAYYSVESGSTVVRLKADYLKSLPAGKHIVGVAYQDGKALAIFSVSEAPRRGVATGDGTNAAGWIVLLAASLVAFGALAFAYVRGGRKRKNKTRR